MLFSSPEFLFGFLPAFLIIYFSVRQSFRNFVLFFASLFFYFAASAELTVILVASVLFNYWAALRIQGVRGEARRIWLIFSVLVNFTPLLYYKYAKFFLNILLDLSNILGITLHIPDINPILPIGISFFTFQAVSYIADVYMDRTKAARSLIDFGMYHSCFPQLIAGPIVRYEEIEPQIRQRTHSIADVHNGIVQFCFGLGKKVILADNMGEVADRVFNAPLGSVDPGFAWVGVIAYTLQIYFDFSGYSDMAIGLGRILGFTYPENFNQPYRALSVTEFWRRWHMTLSRWFRDYVYIPLGGNRLSTPAVLVNLVIVFFLCGLWHGAAYTFVVWGLYHGTLLIAERLGRRWRWFQVPALLRWLYTMLAVMVGWVFFRSATVGDAVSLIGTMLDVQHLSVTQPLIATMTNDKVTYMAIALAVAVAPFQWFLPFVNRQYDFGVWASALSLAVAMGAWVLMSVNGFSPFIYFRF